MDHLLAALEEDRECVRNRESLASIMAREVCQTLIADKGGSILAHFLAAMEEVRKRGRKYGTLIPVYGPERGPPGQLTDRPWIRHDIMETRTTHRHFKVPSFGELIADKDGSIWPISPPPCKRRENAVRNTESIAAIRGRQEGRLRH